MKKLSLIIAIAVCSFNVSAWDGYDYNNGTYIEIGSGNLVRPGQEIEIYDYDTGNYTYVDVEALSSHGSSVEVEVYDYNTGEYRTFDME